MCATVIMFTFSGCGKATTKSIVMDSLAEVRYNVFEGESENFSITFMSGMREEPYLANGKANPLIEFGVITLVSKNEGAVYDTAQKKYIITIDLNSYSGDLDVNPFDRSLVADIQKVVSDTANISIQIIVADITEIVVLTNGLFDATINYDKALTLALDELKAEIKPLIIDKKLNAEVYIKIITDLNRTFNKFYWYVALLDSEGNTVAVIIDPISGELVAKKVE
ncbi:MAG: hypothetical protein WC942_02275 [Clostridia bacterium]